MNPVSKTIRFSIRMAPVLLVLVSALSAHLTPPALGEANPVATAGGQAISREDLATTLEQLYREAALKLIIRKTLINQQAQKLGVDVTDDELDGKFNEWKTSAFGQNEDAFNATLAREGLTTTLYRESFREGMLAEKIVTKTTVLTDRDFDKVIVRPFFLKTREGAEEFYRVVSTNGDATELARQGVEPEVIASIPIQRYDRRMTPAAVDKLFTLTRGDYLDPVPWAEPEGYLVMRISEVRPGTGLNILDRQVVERVLIRQKTARALQDWWVELEKQVKAAMDASTPAPNATPTGAPPGAPPGP